MHSEDIKPNGAAQVDMEKVRLNAEISTLTEKIKALENANSALTVRGDIASEDRDKAYRIINMYRLSFKWVLEHVSTLDVLTQNAIKSDLSSYIGAPLMDKLKEIDGNH